MLLKYSQWVATVFLACFLVIWLVQSMFTHSQVCYNWNFSIFSENWSYLFDTFTHHYVFYRRFTLQNYCQEAVIFKKVAKHVKPNKYASTIAQNEFVKNHKAASLFRWAAVILESDGLAEKWGTQYSFRVIYSIFIYLKAKYTKE